MSSLLDKASGVAKGARTAADLATWAGRWGKRQITANSRGLCLVCNNLQPHGHERTLVRSEGAHADRPVPLPAFSQARKALAPTAAGTTTAMLELSDISTAKLLETREIDPKTGLPKRQCRYCRLLCDIFDQFFIDEWMSWITETHNKMNISVGLMICEGKPLIINCWAFTYDKWILHPRVDLEVYMDQHLQQPGGTLTGPSAATGALPTMGPVAPRAESVSSESCFRFMRDCVSQCLGEHPKCRTQDTGFVPTRLLYLGQDNRDLRIRIGVPPEERIQWAALSHCWGGGTPIKLLQANLTQLTEHVNISDLPATFSNAIDIARFLGLRYLWIDSICIIQDDTHDWDVEASRMGFVYSQAFLVICGASSPNPSTPFLGPREPDWLPKQFDFQTEQGVNVPIMVRQRHLLAAPLQYGTYEPPFTDSWATLKRVGPLYTRGWCFQETFLAQRTLHFAPGAVIFECGTHRRSEDQLPPYPCTLPGTLGGEIPDADKWRTTVKAYTHRQLTFAGDKLPAIGGAASKTPQAQRTTYLAGLWRESLLLDLLWQVMSGGTHQGLMYPKDAGQNAPSWSWASMNRGVTWNPLKEPQLLAEVVSAEVSLDGVNPYGKVSGGRITIRGRAKKCVVTIIRQKNEQWVHYHLPKNNTPSKKQHFRSDGLLTSEANPTFLLSGSFVCRSDDGGKWESEVYGQAIFLCIARTPWMNYNHVGLILSWSKTTPGCFERVGSISNVPSDWYDNGELTTVSIV